MRQKKSTKRIRNFTKRKKCNNLFSNKTLLESLKNTISETEEKAAALRVSRSTLIVEAIRVQLEQIRKRRGFLVPPFKVSSRHKRKVSAQSSGGGEVS